MRFLIFFNLIFSLNLHAQDGLLSSTIIDPSISYQNWVGSASTRNGANLRLRSIYKMNSIGVALDGEYGIFTEKFKDEQLGSAKWKQKVFGISLHLFLAGQNFSFGYAPIHQIETKNIKQFISAQSIRNFSDFSLSGSSIEIQWGVPLTPSIIGHIRFLRATFDEQSISDQELAFQETSINTLFLGISFPFRL